MLCKDINLKKLLFQLWAETEYRLGYIYRNQIIESNGSQSELRMKAKRYFTSCLQKAYPWAHLGLASIENDIHKHIKHLILAARDGAKMGWVRPSGLYAEHKNSIKVGLTIDELFAREEYYLKVNWGALELPNPLNDRFSASVSFGSCCCNLDNCMMCSLDNDEGYVRNTHISSEYLSIDCHMEKIIFLYDTTV